MICVPLDDLEDVTQSLIDQHRTHCPLTHTLLTALLAMSKRRAIDTDVPACPECGDPRPAKNTHCFDCWVELYDD